MRIDNQAIKRRIWYCPKLDTHDIKRLTVPRYDRVSFLPPLYHQSQFPQRSIFNHIYIHTFMWIVRKGYNADIPV